MLTLLEEKQKSLEQNLQAVKLEQQMLKVLCKDSTSVYRVDLMNDRAEIVKIEEHSNSAGDLLPHGQELFSYAEAVEHYYHKCVLKESAPDFLQFLDAENLMRELRTKDRVSRRYQSVPNAIGNIYFEVRANRVQQTETSFQILLDFRSVDEIVREEREHQHALETVLTESRMSYEVILQELIDDVLDISRIESGEFKIVSQLVKLPELFDFYCQAIAGMAEAKNIRFSGKLHDISHNVLLSDQIRLGQIYMNLLSNAVKYMPENGDVKLEVYEEKLAESGKVRLVSVVSDTGIGMTPEFMEQMYSAFSRAVDTRVNKVRGSGLGLAIVKKIVDLMGGAIGAESKVGKGTTFRVTLDLPAAADDAETEEHTETAITLPEKPLTVLVAEDNDLNYEITAEQLRGYRVHCVRAVNGQDCLQRIEQAAPDEFDAILMDMQMPVMNGLEATAAIRKLDSETAKNIPIIALIANAYHEDIQKCLAAGMNAHLSKPINIDRAVRTIIECARTAKGNG